MSHNYPNRGPPAAPNFRSGPYRRPPASDLGPPPNRRLPSDSSLVPEQGSYRTSNPHQSFRDQNFYTAYQASSSSSCQTSLSSSSRAQSTQDGALNILNSCGLEPGDLTLLAELPEDVLTIESLPRVLNQIKGKKGATHTAQPPSSTSSCNPPSSTRQPVCTGNWDQAHSQRLQYPVDSVTSSPAPPDLDKWGNPRTYSSGRVDTSSLSSLSLSSSHLPDSHYRLSGLGNMGRSPSPAPSHEYHHKRSDYGKAGGNLGLVSSQKHVSSLAGGGREGICPSLFPELGPADCRSGLPAEQHLLKTPGGLHEMGTSSTKTSNQVATLPSKKEAMDFHGSAPPSYPYSCCLCDIAVITETGWNKHINGVLHADGQLNLLQRFPKWDCRLESVCRADGQPERKNEGASQPAANQSAGPAPKKKCQKAADRSKVVCVKFPAQCVDEAYLKKLIEPFGRIIKMLKFPSLAFVELGSIDQAKDLVKFHVNNPPTVNGQQIEFRISNTFSFLQSSRVVSFSPAPSGENGKSDLMSVIKRFGLPLFTLFLPSMAFVEMKNGPDAQMLVDYYSSTSLKINDDVIKVSFSMEYNSLSRVALAKRYEEETGPTKRSSSRERKRRRSSKDREEEEKRDESRTRSESRDESKRDKKSRTRSKSRERSRTDERSRTRSESERDKKSRTSESKEKLRQVERTGSTSRDKSSSNGRTTRSTSTEKRSGSQSRPTGGSLVPEVSSSKPPESPGPDPVTGMVQEGAEPGNEEESSDDSDIEGMEVIGEDGECLLDEDMETLDEAEEDDDEEAAERASAPDGEKENKVKDGGAEDEEDGEMKTHEEEEEAAQKDDQEEAGLPEHLENHVDEDEEKRSGSRSQNNDESGEKSLEAETSSGTSPEKSVDEESESGKEKKSSGKESVVTNTAEPVSNETLKTSEENKTKRRQTRGKKSGPKKKKSMVVKQEVPEEQMDAPGLEDLKSSDQPGSTGDPPKPQEQETEVEVEQQSEPAGGDADPQPTNPVGTEFVRPVVGYFCNLCQLIYADEDEAKVQHCSSAAHYRKYQVSVQVPVT
ncbi:matrin 3-like 1.1 isoform X2 [Antennarius striatus]|uniref:matrin 3-like 1.1 isoform X2 n=1 Tax=Antennarius striatus TaxID=241820 RepID=UPI0035B0CF9D